MRPEKFQKAGVYRNKCNNNQSVVTIKFRAGLLVVVTRTRNTVETKKSDNTYILTEGDKLLILRKFQCLFHEIKTFFNTA